MAERGLKDKHKCTVENVIQLSREPVMHLTIVSTSLAQLTFAFEFLKHFVRRTVAVNWIEFIIATHRLHGGNKKSLIFSRHCYLVFHFYLKAVRSAQHDLSVGDTCIYANVVLTIRIVLALQHAHLAMRLRRRPLDAIVGILL